MKFTELYEEIINERIYNLKDFGIKELTEKYDKKRQDARKNTKDREALKVALEKIKEEERKEKEEYKEEQRRNREEEREQLKNSWDIRINNF